MDSMTASLRSDAREAYRMTQMTEEFADIPSLRDDTSHPFSLRKGRRDHISAIQTEQTMSYSSNQQSQDTLQLLSKIPDLYSENEQTLTSTLYFIRSKTQGSHLANLDLLVQNNILPPLHKVLCLDHLPSAQHNALWIITNICYNSKERSETVAYSSCMGKVFELLKSQDLKLAEQAAWLIGNIFDSAPEVKLLFRDVPIIADIIDLLSTREFKLAPFSNIIWALSRIARREPQDPSIALDEEEARRLQQEENLLVSSMVTITPYLCQHDERFLESTLDCLISITDFSDKALMCLSNGQHVQQLVELTSNDHPNIVVKSVHLLGSLAAGTMQMTEMVIQNGAIERMAVLLGRHHNKLTQKICWTFSNISNGTENQIGSLFTTSAITSLLAHLSTFDNVSSQWAARTFLAISQLSRMRSMELMGIGAAPALLGLLSVNSAETVDITLMTIWNLLAIGNLQTRRVDQNGMQKNPVRDKFEMANAQEVIEAFLDSPNQSIRLHAQQIINTHFSPTSYL
ncbi:putative Importin subunit alpha-4 [Blattamonas nauphoetae]|uniref:Importin subunit alpha-4 n=1 Tax=Blattamonas nauphoetae TaxID=2049346 RepID=A0ABQ9Y0B4_9EUKA|nr:putative Importin subunit alpha-4 [Blattamonas nauphoetae]